MMLSIRAIAEKFPLSKSLLYELCKQGRLRHLRVKTSPTRRGKIVVDEEDLKRFLDECVVEDGVSDDGPLKYIR